MDPISELVRSAKIPIGRWGKAFFDFLTTNFEWFFDSIADGVTVVLDGLVDLLLLVPPVLLVAAIAALAWWLQKSWKLALARRARAALHHQPEPLEGNRRDAGAGRRGRRRLDGDRRADRHLGRA